MPDPVAPNDIFVPEANVGGDALLSVFFDNRCLNSTITETFHIQEAHQPQTDITIRPWTAAPPVVIRTTNIRSNLKYSYKSAASLTSLGSANILVIVPEMQENPFLASAEHPTTVLPTAISSNWNDLAGGGLSEKIYQRLLELAGLTAGWNGSGSLGMNASSLWSFIAFWKQVRQFSAEPELVLTPSGHLQAEWSKNSKHCLEIDFRGSGENSYFALIDGRKAVIEGAASIKEIFKIITSYQDGVALTWQYEQEK
jgi:hypothetical protein